MTTTAHTLSFPSRSKKSLLSAGARRYLVLRSAGIRRSAVHIWGGHWHRGCALRHRARPVSHASGLESASPAAKAAATFHDARCFAAAAAHLATGEPSLTPGARHRLHRWPLLSTAPQHACEWWTARLGSNGHGGTATDPDAVSRGRANGEHLAWMSLWLHYLTCSCRLELTFVALCACVTGCGFVDTMATSAKRTLSS
jgi:hypothetical protein